MKKLQGVSQDLSIGSKKSIRCRKELSETRDSAEELDALSDRVIL